MATLTALNPVHCAAELAIAKLKKQSCRLLVVGNVRDLLSLGTLVNAGVSSNNGCLISTPRSFSQDLVDFRNGTRRHLFTTKGMGLTGYSVKDMRALLLISLVELNQQEETQFVHKLRCAQNGSVFLPLNPNFAVDEDKPKHQIGDRVSGLVYVGDPNQSHVYKSGVVIARYSHKSIAVRDYSFYDEYNGETPHFLMPSFHYNEQYAIRFDDGSVDCGFLPHGLHKEDVYV